MPHNRNAPRFGLMIERYKKEGYVLRLDDSDPDDIATLSITYMPRVPMAKVKNIGEISNQLSKYGDIAEPGSLNITLSNTDSAYGNWVQPRGFFRKISDTNYWYKVKVLIYKEFIELEGNPGDEMLESIDIIDGFPVEYQKLYSGFIAHESWQVDDYNKEVSFTVMPMIWWLQKFEYPDDYIRTLTSIRSFIDNWTNNLFTFFNPYEPDRYELADYNIPNVFTFDKVNDLYPDIDETFSDSAIIVMFMPYDLASEDKKFIMQIASKQEYRTGLGSVYTTYVGDPIAGWTSIEYNTNYGGAKYPVANPQTQGYYDFKTASRTWTTTFGDSNHCIPCNPLLMSSDGDDDDRRFPIYHYNTSWQYGTRDSVNGVISYAIGKIYDLDDRGRNAVQLGYIYWLGDDWHHYAGRSFATFNHVDHPAPPPFADIPINLGLGEKWFLQPYNGIYVSDPTISADPCYIFSYNESIGNWYFGDSTNFRIKQIFATEPNATQAPWFYALIEKADSSRNSESTIVWQTVLISSIQLESDNTLDIDNAVTVMGSEFAPIDGWTEKTDFRAFVIKYKSTNCWALVRNIEEDNIINSYLDIISFDGELLEHILMIPNTIGTVWVVPNTMAISGGSNPLCFVGISAYNPGVIVNGYIKNVSSLSVADMYVPYINRTDNNLLTILTNLARSYGYMVWINPNDTLVFRPRNSRYGYNRTDLGMVALDHNHTRRGGNWINKFDRITYKYSNIITKSIGNGTNLDVVFPYQYSRDISNRLATMLKTFYRLRKHGNQSMRLYYTELTNIIFLDIAWLVWSLSHKIDGGNLITELELLENVESDMSFNDIMDCILSSIKYNSQDAIWQYIDDSEPSCLSLVCPSCNDYYNILVTLLIEIANESGLSSFDDSANYYVYDYIYTVYDRWESAIFDLMTCISTYCVLPTEPLIPLVPPEDITPIDLRR